jgi:DNA-binding transcriptional LysR family regulator
LPAPRAGSASLPLRRAIAFLENHVGAELLHRTTRSLKLSEAGERYAAACRRVLTDLEEADIIAAGERTAPRGLLTITAPVTSGEEILRPIIDAFLDEYPAVNMRLHLLDRPVNLIDEGIDLALRIAHLADSSLVAIRVGDVRRVVVAAPRYLAQHPVIGEPQIEPNRVTNDAGWEAVANVRNGVHRHSYLIRGVTVTMPYARYYDEVRTRRSLGKDAPEVRSIQLDGTVNARPVLGGLHHHYVRV